MIAKILSVAVSLAVLQSDATTLPIAQNEVVELSDEDLALEMMCDDMETVAVMVMAEAGNQDLDGMRLVADVILNRVDSDKFPDTVDEVIYDDGQFGPITDGRFYEVGWYMNDDVYKAVEMEWNRETRLDQDVLYFNTSWDNGSGAFKHGDHWFSY